MTASQSTALMRWKMRSRRMPALLTTQSTRPKLSMAVLMMRSAPCGSATLSPLETAMPPAFLISATTWSATLTSAPSPSAEPPRSLTTILAPSAAASSEISRPLQAAAGVDRAQQHRPEPHAPQPILILLDADRLADQRAREPHQRAAPLDLAIHPYPPHSHGAGVLGRAQPSAPAAWRGHVER